MRKDHQPQDESTIGLESLSLRSSADSDGDSVEEVDAVTPGHKKHTRYLDEVRDRFIDLVAEGTSVAKAARELGVNINTAYMWKKKYFEKSVRMWVLNKEAVSPEPSSVPTPTTSEEESDEELVAKIYRFKQEAWEAAFQGKITWVDGQLKEVHEYFILRVPRTQAKYTRAVKEQQSAWARKHVHLDFMENVVFIGEAVFNINTKPAAEAKVPATGPNFVLLGAICSIGMVSLEIINNLKSLGKPEAEENFRVRKITSNVFGEFMKGVVHELTTTKKLSKLRYLLLDDVSYHLREKLEPLLEGTDLELVYLPPGLDEVNSIEPFWATRNDTMRTHLLLEEIASAPEGVSSESIERFLSSKAEA